MKLCIIKPNTTSEEIALDARPPSLENINNELLFLENYFYKIIIRSEETVANAELFIGDYSVHLTYDELTGCWETEKELIFQGCYDLAYISVSYENYHGKEDVCYTDYLRIATTKQTAKQVEEMLQEIETSLPNFLEICFSRNKKESGLIKNDTRSIWNTLKIIDEIINIYEENYGSFCNQKKTSVEQVSAIVDIKSMRQINQDSLIWLAMNPDNFVRTDKDNGISINGDKYIPAKIKTYVSQYSYDVYENRVVLGFLKSIIKYMDDQILGFSKEMIELENIPDSIIIKIPNTHVLTGRCVYVYYRGIIQRFQNRSNLLKEIYYRYDIVLNCTPELILNTPKLTNTFKQVYHYRLCYEIMVKWFEAGDYSFSHLNYLFKLKTLSRIFEYYCLIKLYLAISQNGYICIESDRIVYDRDDNIEDINNQYKFKGQGQEIVLLYEPAIWVDKMNGNMNLYSTGFNFIKSKWNNRWTPDFVLKILVENKEYYYILDAKYSSAQNVKKWYMPKLVLEYSAQIASKDKHFSDVIGVGALYPSDQGDIYYFKKNGVQSCKQSLPQYFSLPIFGDEKGTNKLSVQIASLLRVIKIIEDKNVPAISIEQSSKLDAIGVKSNVAYETKNIVINVGESEENGEKKEHELEVVNGKKCFYYGRGLCLKQKIRCTIDHGPCAFYVHKANQELLKEETCRNFCRYVKRGRIYRVECTISGMPGCVGSETCQFYLKKKH